MTVDDLLPYCKKCRGTGKREESKPPQNQTGYGARIVYFSSTPCDGCAGLGVVPTELGTALLEFFIRAKSTGLLS